MTTFVRVAGALAVVLATGCGAKGKSAAPTTLAHRATTTVGRGVPGALQAEANATAAGDIPDNQVFLVFRNGAARYSMKYPEGWAQQGVGNRVTFRDKNNIVRVVVAAAVDAPTKASVQADVSRLSGAQIRHRPQAATIAGKPAFKVVYSTESAPNAVTGKRLRLVVDRYYLWSTGHRAVVDLGTPEGVDNVDAYRLMIESFTWR